MVSFLATEASTNISFVFREDPAFLHLDDIVLTTFCHLSDNGQSGTSGNGIDLIVYAGAVPVRATAVPEPATLGVLGLGLAALGFARRKMSA